MKKTNQIVYNYEMKEGTLSFEKKASRLELLIRIFYTFFLGLVYFIYSIGYSIIIMILGLFAAFVNFLNWWYILFFGKRWEFAFEFTRSYFYDYTIRYYLTLLNYWMRYVPYSMLMTDERPPLGMHESNEKYFKKL